MQIRRGIGDGRGIGDVHKIISFCLFSEVETVSKGTETVRYEYDGSLVTKETSGGTLNQSLDYKFNNDFALENFTYAGSTATYTYDNDGLLTGVGNFTITRNLENGLPEAVTGGNLNIFRTFNGYGETESQDYIINSQGKYSWGVTRDDNGRIITKTETVDGETSEYIYDYDPIGRLLSVKDENGTLLEEYRYEPNGTRYYEMNAHRGIAERNMTYYDDDCLMTAGESLYEYNIDGFLEKKTEASGETLYDYSSRGELLSVTLPGGTVIEYVHDPLGRRIAKKKNGVIVEKYLWQDIIRLLAVYDKNDSLIMRFEYADERMPVAMITNDGLVFYLTYDQIGSLRIIANTSGTVKKRVNYDSFGNIILDTDSAFEIPFGFAGGLHDRNTGLVRFGYRDYDPDVGRWTAKDPILFSGGDTDLYGYVLNNPINLIDSLGLQHSPGGPWHPPDGVSTGCRETDSCSELSNKMRLLKKMIAKHIEWDYERGTTIHADDIAQLRNAYQKCVSIYLKKCANRGTPKLTPQNATNLSLLLFLLWILTGGPFRGGAPA